MCRLLRCRIGRRGSRSSGGRDAGWQFVSFLFIYKANQGGILILVDRGRESLHNSHILSLSSTITVLLVNRMGKEIGEDEEREGAYPCTSSYKVITWMRGWSNNRQDHNKNPDADQKTAKAEMLNLMSLHDRKPSMNRNRQDPNTARHIANLHQPSLDEARSGRSQDLILRDPVETDQECDGLLQIREDEVKDQEEVLVITWVCAVEFPPEDQAVGDEQA